MRGVCEFDQYPMSPGRQPNHDDGLARGIDEMPGRIVYSDMHVTNARRDIECSCAEYRHDAQVFRTVLDEDKALREVLWKRWINEQLGWRLVFNCDKRRRTNDVTDALTLSGCGGESRDSHREKPPERDFMPTSADPSVRGQRHTL
ncbi:hypothetical protein MPLA_860070 [Mesorhizobium sp. ORS 3359]|nr:hypothetical protein MPLA_860070 [Mesorhizobium sp. ORS 3359]